MLKSILLASVPHLVTDFHSLKIVTAVIPSFLHPYVKRWIVTSNYLIEMLVTFFITSKLVLRLHFFINSKKLGN